jgi:hypothetical protein
MICINWTVCGEVLFGLINKLYHPVTAVADSKLGCALNGLIFFVCCIFSGRRGEGVGMGVGVSACWREKKERGGAWRGGGRLLGGCRRRQLTRAVGTGCRTGEGGRVRVTRCRRKREEWGSAAAGRWHVGLASTVIAGTVWNEFNDIHWSKRIQKTPNFD